MSFELPPVVKQAELMLDEVEKAVHRFARFHKYTFGMMLREQAFKVARLAHRAWRDRARQGEWLDRLVWSVDDLKLTLQLGKRIRAFASFGQFEMIARITAELGKQVGGWKRQQQHPNGQNAQPGVEAQRPKILSTRAASCEANP
ncbi:MAG: four helix bundle protein [Rudaea sp.]|nr:four helix bundle protein [Rudaea sp.]